MPDTPVTLREFVYLDAPRVGSLAAQLGLTTALASDRPAAERLFIQIEAALAATSIDADFDFSRWTPDAFADGQVVRASGVVRLMDFAWLADALAGLPAVLRKMSKLEMEALRNSDEGRRMSKQQLQARQNENQVAIAKVEEFKSDELGEVVRRLYPDVVRLKLRPSPEHPAAVLVGSAHLPHFYDSAAALSQKYGIEIDAGWTVLGQVNRPNLSATPQPIPTGNKMEDAFEQIALLMNGAFRLANAPAFPAFSLTPLAIYRNLRAS
ncbi:MAG TPA: hypothetical protein VH475_18615 [Tepidisphaeraceae bacterium]|jgi:hypothetical protein